MNRRLLLASTAMLTLLALMPLLSARAQDAPADLIVINARVTTQNATTPEAEALAVRDGFFVAVGTANDAMKLAGEKTQIIDASGRRVIPGLNDSHLHAVRGGRFYNLELRWDDAPSLEEGLAMIREAARHTPEGQWVRVIGGWSPYQFEERRMPTIAELNEAAPETPVFVLFLYSQGFLNRTGVERLGITPTTEPPAGSRYEFIDGGAILHAEPNPTILYQTIARLPQLSPEDQVNSTRHFYRELNRLGLTSAIDAGGGGHAFPENYEGSRVLAETEGLPLRISYYLFPQKPGKELQDFERWIEENTQGSSGDANHIHGYELEGGGEFLTWSAGDFENFMAPRPDLADGYRGELKAVTELLVRNGWPIRIHATYDESISKILDVFEEVFREQEYQGRWVIDHAETLSQTNMERIRAMGGGVAIQNRMAFAGEAFVERYGEDAAKTAPPLRKLLDLGVPVGAGTDGTRVSSHNPWRSLKWMVTGRTVGGLQLASPDNRLTREEALRLYTLGSAWISGEEEVKGRIAPGQFADFAILSEDYLTVPEDKINGIESVLTVVGGDIVYGADEFGALSPSIPPVSPAWSPVTNQAPELGGKRRVDHSSPQHAGGRE